MTIKAIKTAATGKPSTTNGVSKPFDAVAKELNSKRVETALGKLKGLPPKELAGAIKRDLPQLARPLAQMIALLDHPDQILQGIPERGEATRVATSGWAMLDKLVNLAEPTPPGGWGARNAAGAHTQLVNLLKSELGR